MRAKATRDRVAWGIIKSHARHKGKTGFHAKYSPILGYLFPNRVTQAGENSLPLYRAWALDELTRQIIEQFGELRHAAIQVTEPCAGIPNLHAHRRANHHHFASRFNA